jgi:hypothetical protein
VIIKRESDGCQARKGIPFSTAKEDDSTEIGSRILSFSRATKGNF